MRRSITPDLSPSITALTAGLNARRMGRRWIACCPAHDDRSPSLSISDRGDGVPLVHCHAGCEQRRVIDALKLRELWPINRTGFRSKVIRSHPTPQATEIEDGENDRNSEAALHIWRTTQPASGTPVERYLRQRGITLQVPETLRFHPGLKHPSGSIWPAMVALVTRGADNVSMAVHRTFLSLDGNAKAPVEPQKMMLGPCCGGSVQLAPADELLMVGEGIETCLAAMQATRLPAWAALSTSGLRSLDLPEQVRDVIVLADADDPGEAAARDAARRWKRQGRHVRIARPPRGADFNDLLMGRAPRIEEGAA